jgi:hypothetical protein
VLTEGCKDSFFERQDRLGLAQKQEWQTGDKTAPFAMFAIVLFAPQKLRNCFKTPDESENVKLRVADEGKFSRDSGSYRLKICHSMPPEDGDLWPLRGFKTVS